MTQATYQQLFGTGSALKNSGDTLTESGIFIPLSGLLSGAALNATSPTAVQAFSAVVEIASDWLSTNTDESVMATSSQSTFAPTTRNGLTKTQFSHNLSFYGSYTAPTFDPDQI